MATTFLLLRSYTLLLTMKTTTTFLLLACPFLFFAFSVQLSEASACCASDEVCDIDGKALRTGVEYYILPVIRGRGGGLALGKKLNGSRCPLEVVQEQAEVSNGLPTTFTPVDPKAKKIRVSTDLNVKFSAMSVCVQSMVWRMAEFDEATGQRFIEMSGVEGNPSPETIANWLKIERDGESKDYKLVFCPGVCNFCKFICREVGIYIGGDGVRRLALVDLDEKPFKIMFKKATSTY